SIADLKYHWSDASCNSCKLNNLERGCIFPASPGQTIGSLQWDNAYGVTLPNASATSDCLTELVWKSENLLAPGTYTVPIQLTLPKSHSDTCKLIIDRFCIHLTAVDEECHLCDVNICSTPGGGGGTGDGGGDPDNKNCTCNAGNNWTSLYLVPTQPATAIPRTQIICGSTLMGYQINTPYNLTGIYHCTTGCTSTGNTIQVKNRLGEIIYTRAGMLLNDVIEFPAEGLYTITLTAKCGDKICECVFRVDIRKGNDNPPVVTTFTPTVTSSKVDSVLKKILPPNFNGSIIVSQNDSIIIERYVSFKDKVEPGTAFDIASIAKTFTGAAVLKLIEEGKISLNDNLTKYLPNFPVKNITIRMLLSHRTGLEDYVKFMEVSGWDRKKHMTNADLLQYIIDNISKVQIATPGSVFDYSNTNFALLALVIEKVSGKLYPDYMRDKIFKPLGMNDTYVFRASDFSTATKSYYKNGQPYGLKYLDLIYGDKNIYSSARDMLKWDKALRTNKFLSKASIDLSYTPTVTPVPYRPNYGLGWRLMFVPNGKKIVYHNGWWHGNRAMFIRLVDEQAVIIILSNNNFTTISESRKLTDLFGQYQQTTRNFVNF
ncbi:MAG TPA: serine hydrolase domain-containing protein, partial [Flavisolibacter sp.]|nr:serine hydrolase domain-containing protein [Flavisolibacter sp.]